MSKRTAGLDLHDDGEIVFSERKASGRRHAYSRTVCLDMDDGVRRLREAAGIKGRTPTLNDWWHRVRREWGLE